MERDNSNKSTDETQEQTASNQIKILEQQLEIVREQLKAEQFKNEALHEELVMQQFDRIDLRVRNKQLDKMLDRAELLFEDLKEKMTAEGPDSKNIRVYESVQKEWYEIIRARPESLPESPPLENWA